MQAGQQPEVCMRSLLQGSEQTTLKTGVACFRQELAGAMEAGDSQKFADSLAEFDSMTRLDAWKTSLLLKVRMARSHVSSTFSVRDINLLMGSNYQHDFSSRRLARVLSSC
jgi:Soluble NSF attachment protein, SNAP